MVFVPLVLGTGLLLPAVCFIFYKYTVTNTAILYAAILAVLSVLFVAGVIARRLTRAIVDSADKVDFEDEVFPDYDELYGFTRKMKRQKQAWNRQLEELENRANTFRTITENMKEGLILADKNGTILSANHSALEIFQETDIVDKNILYVCRDMDLLNGMRRCFQGEPSEILFKRGGRQYNSFLNPVHNGEEISGAILLFLDTTEKFKSEKQRKEFSANVSHELKTPLTTISALSEMIGTGMAQQADIEGFALKINAQTKRLIHMIDDIIRLSEFDEGNIAGEFTSIDLYVLAEAVISSLQDQAREKRVTVRLEGEPLRITANERMIDELLFNLVENAVKYNKEDGKVTLYLTEEEGCCKISVADTGIGIPKRYQSRVFERFYRVDKSRSQKTGGTGLGLSIVKHVVEYHRGSVEMESEEGVGTTITCVLPK